MAYLFSQLNKLGDEFRSVFGIGFKPFYDGLMSVACKHLCIDIPKFDEWLHQQHGNYEDDGKSMDDIIREHYGEKGLELINELMGGDPLDAPEPVKPKKKAKRKKKVTITEEQLEKDGVVEFVRKDCYGITYEMKAFRMGYALNGRVLTEDGRLIFHNELSFDSFELLKLAFERTAETMADDEYPIHKKHADMAKKMGELTLAERLRQALLKQMQQAA